MDSLLCSFTSSPCDVYVRWEKESVSIVFCVDHFLVLALKKGTVPRQDFWILHHWWLCGVQILIVEWTQWVLYTKNHLWCWRFLSPSLFSSPSTTGLPDSSAGMINPYPLVELKNFTCPDFRGADDADDDIGSSNRWMMYRCVIIKGSWRWMVLVCGCGEWLTKEQVWRWKRRVGVCGAKEEKGERKGEN